MSYSIDDLVMRLFTKPEYDSFSDFRLLVSDRFPVYLDHRNQYLEVEGCLDDKVLEPAKLPYYLKRSSYLTVEEISHARDVCKLKHTTCLAIQRWKLGDPKHDP